jgi:hypothetical protein
VSALTNLERFCRCGCGASLEGMRESAVYASASCRTRAWKAREGITGYRAVKASQNARASGLQVSYRKAVEALADFVAVEGIDRAKAIAEAERILRLGLSDRQRAALERRDAQ